MLVDKHNRIHTYLRIALVDTCNFRCTYCMPTEKMKFLPNKKLMSATEIITIAKEFISNGVTKIRLTGGEPLVRKDFGEIVQELSNFPIELSLTTNGVFLNEHISTLKKAGIRSINVSLDTLVSDKFLKITKRDLFNKVWSNILLLIENNFRVKINVVLMKGVNDNEINRFIALTKQLPIHIRFIEFMPFAGNKWDNSKVITTKVILQTIEEDYAFVKIEDKVHDTCKKYKPLGHEGTFAIITTMSQPFCSDCNRLRLTADGKMKNCLFSAGEVDLLTAFRSGESIIPLIKQSLLAKHKERGGQFNDVFTEIDSSNIINRSMIKIGG